MTIEFEPRFANLLRERARGAEFERPTGSDATAIVSAMCTTAASTRRDGVLALARDLRQLLEPSSLD